MILKYAGGGREMMSESFYEEEKIVLQALRELHDWMMRYEAMVLKDTPFNIKGRDISVLHAWEEKGYKATVSASIDRSIFVSTERP